MKKIIVVLIVLMICVLNPGIGNCEVGKAGKFERVYINDYYEYIQTPIAINDKEIFSPGGMKYILQPTIVNAKKYNIDTEELVDLGITMNVPRKRYRMIKYDDEHILIIGGEAVPCSKVSSELAKEAPYIAEIYDIKENKFTRIQNTPFAYERFKELDYTILKDGRVLICVRDKKENWSFGIEIFDPKTGSFENYYSQVVNLEPEMKYSSIGVDGIVILNPNEILFWRDFYDLIQIHIFDINQKKFTSVFKDNKDFKYKYVNFCNLDSVIGKLDDNTLLFRLWGLYGSENKTVEYDITEKKFKNVKAYPKLLDGPSILLENGNILFTGGRLKKWDWCCLDVEVLLFGKHLHHAVYDYKNNKVYNYKSSYYFNEKKQNWSRFVKMKKSVYVISTRKNYLYKY